jgi:hypothetical protein
MGRSINLRTRLSLPPRADWDTSRAPLQRWADSLPFGSAGFHVTRDANGASIPSLATASVTFTEALDDQENWFGPSSTNTLVVPPGMSGLYALDAYVRIGLTPVASWSISIHVNGLAVCNSDFSSQENRRSTSAITPLRDGDRLSLSVHNSSIDAITPNFTPTGAVFPRSPFLRGYRISLL